MGIQAIFLAALPSVIHADTGDPAVLNPLVVKSGEYMEEQPVGEAGQPEWLFHRRFSNTRVYIQKDPWEMGMEQWYRLRTFDGGRTTQRSQTEFEIGLPFRMQLDLYEKYINDGDGGWKQDEFAVELRYAFADWGVIPGNPTMYVEYAFLPGGPDALETKLLFGDDCHGWHWGLNLINAHKLWGPDSDENEWAVAAGISRTIIDNALSVGVEGQWTHEDHQSSEVILGPSIQWLPTSNTHVDLVAMAGLTEAAPNAECWLVVGFDFGSGDERRGYKPTTVGGL